MATSSQMARTAVHEFIRRAGGNTPSTVEEKRMKRPYRVDDESATRKRQERHTRSSCGASVEVSADSIRDRPRVGVIKPTSAYAGVHIHIDADGLIRDNRERLRFRADALRCAPLHIQNIIARRQSHAIVPILVRGNPRDFFLSGLAQDDQRIFGITYGCPFLRFPPQAEPS